MEGSPPLGLFRCLASSAVVRAFSMTFSKASRTASDAISPPALDTSIRTLRDGDVCYLDSDNDWPVEPVMIS
jgi:hypothetical protein